MTAIPWKPTADLLALAIVTACRATGENPEKVLESSEYGIRSKHYCVHALVHLFGSEHHAAIATYLNVPGKATYFRRSSLWWVLGQNPHKRKQEKAAWWDDGVFADLIQTLEDHHKAPADRAAVINSWMARIPRAEKSRQVRMPAKVGDPPKPSRVGSQGIGYESDTPEVAITARPTRTVNIPEASRIGSSAPIMGGGPPRQDYSLHVKPSEKRSMAETLADAVKNTQRMNEAVIAKEEGKNRGKGR